MDEFFGAEKTVVYLHFEDPNAPFYDTCGNKWNALNYEDLPASEYDFDNLLTTGKFGNGIDFGNKIHLKIDKPIKLGGKNFTVDFWYQFQYYQESTLGLFEIVSAKTNELLVNLFYSGYEWKNDDGDAPTLMLNVRNGNGNISSYKIFIPFEDWHHYAYVYNDNTKEAVFYLDGVAVANIYLDGGAFPEQECSITIGKVAEGYYQLYGQIDEFRIVNGLALWDENFTPPSQQIMFYKVDENFDTQRNVSKSLSLDFDLQRKIIPPGTWYYENFGNASLIAPEAADVEGTTVTDLSSDFSKTGSAYWVQPGLLKNMFGLQPTKEIWAKFDCYLSASSIIYSYALQTLGSNYRYYGFRLIGRPAAETDKPIAVLLAGSSYTPVDSLANQKLTGLHSFLVHLLSDAENGKIELWIDDETTPALTFSGNVWGENDFTNFYVSSDDDRGLISNLIVSNSRLSITDNVQFIGYSYVKDFDLERVLTNDTLFSRVLDATKVLLTFDKEDAPFEDLGGNHWAAFGNPTISNDKAKFGKALQLDGESYLQLENKIELGGQDFTIDGWFSIPSEGLTGSYRYICFLVGDEIGNYSGNYEITFYCSYADQAHFDVTLPDKTNSAKRSGASQIVYDITRNEIHYFALCFHHKTQKITFAIDGKVYNKDIHSVDEKMSYAVSVGYNARTSFRGTIDEFRIINGVALYSHDFTPPVKSAWGKNIDENFDIVRQIPNKLVIEPTEDFFPVSKKETDGVQSIEISIAEQQLTDQLSFTSINHADIMQQVQGQYLDYQFSVRVESITQRGILNTCQCCADIDEILYSQLSYKIERRQRQGGTYAYVLKKNTTQKLQMIEPPKAKASAHITNIARILGKEPVLHFSDFVSTVDTEQEGVTYGDLIRDLFGWTSRIPTRLINCFIRDNKLYVIQRGHEQNTLDLTDSKFSNLTINKNIVRTAWGVTPTTVQGRYYQEPILGSEISEDPPDTPEEPEPQEPELNLTTSVETSDKTDVSSIYTTTTYEYDADGALLSTEITETAYVDGEEPSERTATTINEYEETSTGKELVKETTTVYEDGELDDSQSKVTTHTNLNQWQKQVQTVAFNGDIHTSVTTSIRLNEKPTPYERQLNLGKSTDNAKNNFKDYYGWYTYQNGKKVAITGFRGVPITEDAILLYDSSFPVEGVQDLIDLTSQLKWLNRKVQETVTLDVYDFPHVIDFNDRIIFHGESYFLQSNTVSKNAQILNKQSLRLVRWY